MRKIWQNCFNRLNILLMIGIFFVISCTNQEKNNSGDQKDFQESILKENQMMRFFNDKHPDFTILKYAEADLNNDGRKDLIVIYQIGKNQNQISVIQNRESDFMETNPLPAPVSDQMVQFRNIDEKPPLEFILQGRKGAKVGYAIFRIEDGKLVDLFGEGMEDCC